MFLILFDVNIEVGDNTVLIQGLTSAIADQGCRPALARSAGRADVEKLFLESSFFGLLVFFHLLVLGAQIAANASLEEWKAQPAQREVARGDLVAEIRKVLNREA